MVMKLEKRNQFSLCMFPWLMISVYLNIFTQEGTTEFAWQSTSSHLSLWCQRSWFNSQSYCFLTVCPWGRPLISRPHFFIYKMGQCYNSELIRGLCELSEIMQMKPLALRLKQLETSRDVVNVNSKAFWVLVCVLVVQLCPTLCDPMYCNPLGCSIHGILQARILEWVAIPFSRGSSLPRDQTQVSCITGRFFTIWASREDPLSAYYVPSPLLCPLFDLIMYLSSVPNSKWLLTVHSQHFHLYL